jgi:uncharacterized Zn-binding protein involved in type VI secretion
MAPPTARLGDTSTHGGAIATASPNVSANSIPVARLHDQFNCPLHGTQQIVTASGTVKANGRGVARIGDLISCGATISSGSPNVTTGD